MPRGYLFIGKALASSASHAAKGGDVVKAANKTLATSAALAQYAKVGKDAVAIANNTQKLATSATTYAIKGTGKVGAPQIQKIAAKLKELPSYLKKWRQGYVKTTNSPQMQQLQKNIEQSKIYDRTIIKSTAKPLNPFNIYNGSGSMKI